MVPKKCWVFLLVTPAVRPFVCAPSHSHLHSMYSLSHTHTHTHTHKHTHTKTHTHTHTHTHLWVMPRTYHQFQHLTHLLLLFKISNLFILERERAVGLHFPFMLFWSQFKPSSLLSSLSISCRVFNRLFPCVSTAIRGPAGAQCDRSGVICWCTARCCLWLAPESCVGSSAH